MLNLQKGYEGTINILGYDISKDDNEYKYKIGYVPENVDLYENLTGYEMLDFFGKIYKVPEQKLEDKIRSLASLLEIENSLAEQISTYSKGMKQRLILISALLHNPEIIFLDEPLNGLDANSVQILKSLLNKLAKSGKTIFYSSHLMDVVEKISDRIILIQAGEIIADGTFTEIQELSKSGSLEMAFGNLTGFTKSESVAKDIISVLES
jgi:ABC-2 type transport system ATP-binding protein